MNTARPDRMLLLPWIAVIAGFLLFAGLTVAYVTWSVSRSQHDWCATINLLNKAPDPSPPAQAQNAPARAYDRQLAADFRALKDRLGC